MKLTLVAGARPNFMKIAPIIRAIEKARNKRREIDYRLIHTGQHYDDSLSASFFKDLNIPEPHSNLGSGSGSQAEQTAAIMVAFEKELIQHKADAVVVVGDVNSTLACSIVAKKLLTDVVHVEAGIRSGDRTMPEEINRRVTDSICDYFFTTTPEAGTNLVNAGAAPDRIFFVGNTMIDSLIGNLERFQKPALFDRENIASKRYLVLTLHRPSNVDDPAVLEGILNTLSQCSGGLPVIFPVHPRTRKTLNGLKEKSHLIPVEPLPYLEFMYLIRDAAGVITDSGGIQEETTYLKIPCITLRNTTERPETVALGTNELVGNDKTRIMNSVNKLLKGNWKTGRVPELWDGRASERIIEKLVEIYLIRPSAAFSGGEGRLGSGIRPLGL